MDDLDKVYDKIEKIFCDYDALRGSPYHPTDKILKIIRSREKESLDGFIDYLDKSEDIMSSIDESDVVWPLENLREMVISFRKKLSND